MALMNTYSIVHTIITCQMIVSRTIQWLIELKHHKLGHKDLLIEVLLIQDTLRFVKRSVIGDTTSSKINYESLHIGLCTANATLKKVEERVSTIFGKDGMEIAQRDWNDGAKIWELNPKDQKASYYEESEMIRPLQAILLSPIFPDLVGGSPYKNHFETNEWKNKQSNNASELEQVPVSHYHDTQVEGSTHLGNNLPDIGCTSDTQLPETKIQGHDCEETPERFRLISPLHHPVSSNITNMQKLVEFAVYATLIILLVWSIRRRVSDPSELMQQPTTPFKMRYIFSLFRLLGPVMVIFLSSRHRIRKRAMFVAAAIDVNMIVARIGRM